MLRLMHLKMREIGVINQQINSNKPGSFRKNLKNINGKTLLLRKALIKEKKLQKKLDDLKKYGSQSPIYNEIIENKIKVKSEKEMKKK